MKSQYPWPNAKIGSDEKLTKTNTKSKFNYYDYITMKTLKWYLYKWTLDISWDICILFTHQWQDIKRSSYI